ncbi:hypothetical protein ACQZEX_10060, partial [Corynebacterium diphtheriae]
GSKRIHVLLFHSDLLVDFTSHEIVNLLVAPHGGVLLANPDSSMVTALYNRELLTCSFAKSAIFLRMSFRFVTTIV